MTVNTMIPVARPWMDEREADAARRAILSGWVTQGPEVAAFEREFGAYAIDLKTPLSSSDPRRQGFLFFQTPDKKAVTAGQQLTLTVERLPQTASITVN